MLRLDLELHVLGYLKARQATPEGATILVWQRRCRDIEEGELCNTCLPACETNKNDPLRFYARREYKRRTRRPGYLSH